MLLRLICLLAVVLPSSLVQAQSLDSPRLNKIEMQIEEIPGGVRVRETSDDPEVAKLIRQHAIRGVSEFVAGGRARAHQPTPLPDEYQASGEKPDS